MTALYIILGIILFFAIILNFSLVFKVAIKEEVVLKIGAFGFYKEIDFEAEDDEEDEETLKKAQKKKKSKTNAHRKKTTEKSFFEVIEFTLNMIKTFLPPVFDMVKKIRLVNLRICLTVVADSADKTAIKFGTTSALIYTFLGQIANLIKVKTKCISINPNFNEKKAEYDISFKIKLRFSTILRAVLRMLFKFLGKITLSNAKANSNKKNINNSNKK